jgi:hypothetical protein
MNRKHTRGYIYEILLIPRAPIAIQAVYRQSRCNVYLRSPCIMIQGIGDWIFLLLNLLSSQKDSLSFICTSPFLVCLSFFLL